jgi:hypothetical protein
MKRFVLLAMLAGSLAIHSAQADSKNSTTLTSPDGQYQLVTSDAWAPADFPVDNVEISAANKSHGEYVEVIAEDLGSYTSSIVRYTQAKRDTMALSLDNPRLTALVESKINGYNAAHCEIHGQLPNTNTSIGYSLTVLKTKTHYIQIVAWTKDSYFNYRKDDLAALAQGFSETSDSPK